MSLLETTRRRIRAAVETPPATAMATTLRRSSTFCLDKSGAELYHWNSHAGKANLEWLMHSCGGILMSLSDGDDKVFRTMPTLGWFTLTAFTLFYKSMK